MRGQMKFFPILGVAAWLGLGSFAAAPGQPTPAPADSAARARALHVLNRLTYGPRPADVDRVVAMGVDKFIDQQLHPEQIADQALDQRLETYRVLKTSADEMARTFAQAQRQQQAQRRERGDSMRLPPPARPDPAMINDPQERERLRQQAMNNPLRRLLGEYQ